MATKRKKKPNCGKGQVCGYSCIPQYNKDGTKRGCGQPVPEEVAEVNLSAVPAKGKKSSGKRIGLAGLVKRLDPNKSALEAVSDIDPQQLKITKKDLGRWGMLNDKDINIATLSEDIKKSATVDDETALALAHGLKTWLSGAYSRLSKKTYQKEGALKEPTSSEDLAALAASAAALKLLPSVTADRLKDTKVASEWDGKTVKRWVTMPDGELDDFIDKYKTNQEVTENGLFGTSIRSNEGMSFFSQPANVEYVVTPKLDGKGRGKYVDSYKRKSFGKKEVTDSEGEVLYEPGTKFKVDKIEKGRKEFVKSIDTLEASDKLRQLEDLDNELKQYIKDNGQSLKDDGFDIEKPFAIPTGGYDEQAKPLTKNVTKGEAIEAIKSGNSLVTVNIKKKANKIYMTEV